LVLIDHDELLGRCLLSSVMKKDTLLSLLEASVLSDHVVVDMFGCLLWISEVVKLDAYVRPIERLELDDDDTTVLVLDLVG
jgi:hypothetical protein